MKRFVSELPASERILLEKHLRTTLAELGDTASEIDDAVDDFMNSSIDDVEHVLPFHHNGVIVLSSRVKNNRIEYVTHQLDADQERINGHYFETYAEALASMDERTDRAIF